MGPKHPFQNSIHYILTLLYHMQIVLNIWFSKELITRWKWMVVEVGNWIPKTPLKSSVYLLLHAHFFMSTPSSLHLSILRSIYPFSPNEFLTFFLRFTSCLLRLIMIFIGYFSTVSPVIVSPDIGHNTACLLMRWP